MVLDVRLPGMDGLSAIGRLRELVHPAPIIVITAFGNLDTAVRAMEGGAFDYLVKPFDLDQAAAAVGRALEIERSAAMTRPAPKASHASAGGPGERGLDRPFAADAGAVQADRPGGARPTCPC